MDPAKEFNREKEPESLDVLVLERAVIPKMLGAHAVVLKLNKSPKIAVKKLRLTPGTYNIVDSIDCRGVDTLRIVVSFLTLLNRVAVNQKPKCLKCRQVVHLGLKKRG